MGAYDLQEYLYFLANQLSADNAEAASFTDRATRIQDTYLYRKEAARNRRSLHKSPRQRGPRYDKRKHRFAAPKQYPAYKVEEAKKQNEERKEQETAEAQAIAQTALTKAASFHIAPPSTVDMTDKVQSYCWVQAIQKVAAEGQLITPNGTPSYSFLNYEYLANLNEFGPRSQNPSVSRLARIAQNGEHK